MLRAAQRITYTFEQKDCHIHLFCDCTTSEFRQSTGLNLAKYPPLNWKKTTTLLSAPAAQ